MTVYEAWGHHPSLSRLPDPPHLVDWVSPQTTGRALCGRELAPRKLEHVGTAAALRVALCRACQRAQEDRIPAKVIDLAGRTRRPRTRRPR